MQKIIYNFAIDNHIENLHSIISAMVVVFVMSFGTACIVNEKEVKETQAWAGIGYIAAKKGVSAEAGLAIGVIGAWEGALQGAAWGAAFGGPAGVGVGLAVGL